MRLCLVLVVGLNVLINNCKKVVECSIHHKIEIQQDQNKVERILHPSFKKKYIKRWKRVYERMVFAGTAVLSLRPMRKLSFMMFYPRFVPAYSWDYII